MLVRCFIAVEINERALERLKEPMKELLKVEGIRTPHPNNLHITLKFLGDVPPDKLERVKQLLSRISFSPFTIRFKGIGVFPNEEYVRIIWAGIESKELIKLAKDINFALKGIFKEEEFTPHLTIGRVSKRVDLKGFLHKYTNKEFGGSKIISFSLVESKLTPRGPIYSEIEKYAETKSESMRPKIGHILSGTTHRS